MRRTQRIAHNDIEVGFYKGEIIVATVPEYQVRLGLRGLQNCLVVHPGKDHQALSHIRLVLLSLLYRAVVQIQVRQGSEALHRLGAQVAVRHRVAQGCQPHALVHQ